jgi:Lar family restriction alleviation protein
MEEIKPCPFCGFEKIGCYSESGGDYAPDGYFYSCDKCDAQAVSELTTEKALEAWNKRAVDLKLVALEAQNQELARAVKENLERALKAEYKRKRKR